MSKKIKGTKVDLATFNEDTSASTAPTFPNRSTQSRENGNRFSTLDDGPNDYRGGGDRGGGFRGGGDDGGFGGMPESVTDGDNNWRKAAPSGGTNFIRPQGGGFAGDRGGRSLGDRGRGGPDRYGDTSNAERPRLNLAPRSAGAGGARPILSAAASTTTENGDDKWSTVFKNSVSIGSNRGAGGGGKCTPLEQKKVLKDDISGKTVLSVSKTVSIHWDKENINVFENEKKWLKKLKDTDIVAKPISFNDQTRTITTEYAGEKITKKTLPENWKEQFRYILSTLQKNNCRHNDIKPDELLVYNNKIKIVDFNTLLVFPIPSLYFL